MRSIAVLMLIVGFAAAVRAPYLADSLWLDELHTSWVVHDSWSDVSPRAHLGNQSPLWFFGTKLLQTVLGESEITLRLASLIPGLLLIVAGYWSVWEWTGKRLAALFAAGLLSLDHDAIFYATEARPYALVEFLAVLHLGIVHRVWRSGSRQWRVARVVNLAFLFYSHYTAALFIFGESLAWMILATILVFRGERSSARLSAALVDTLAVLALCLPALPYLRDIFERRTLWAEFVPRPDWRSWFEIFPLVSYVMVPYGLLVVQRIGSSESPARGEKTNAVTTGSDPCDSIGLAIFLLMIMMLSLGIAWTASILNWARVFHIRYLVAATVLGPLFSGAILACSMQAAKRRSVWFTASLLVVTLVSLIYQEGYTGFALRGVRWLPGKHQDWRGAIRRIGQNYPTSPFPVFLRSGLMEARSPNVNDFPESYLLFPLRAMYPIVNQPIGANQAEVFMVPLFDSNRFQLTSQHRRFIEESGGAWFIVNLRGSSPQQIAQKVLQANWPEQSGQWQVEQDASFGDIQVFCLVARSQ